MTIVAIAHFDGPLDLLLVLVRSNQYPLDALPIAEITRQYLAYLKAASDADMEFGGAFLETASWLVLLKSRAILPQVAGEEPPGREPERALLQHETLKATADLLYSRLDATAPGPGKLSGASPGTGPGEDEGGLPAEPSEIMVAPPTVQDALAAARRALALAKAHSQHSRTLDAESYPVAKILRLLERRLEALGPGRGVRQRHGLRS